jgi:hypothetical protein
VKASGSILAIIMVFMASVRAEASLCEKWFAKTGLKPENTDCLSDCVVADVDMGTFSCTNQCATSCKKPIHKDFTFKVTELYGLTLPERALVAENPTEGWKVYSLSYKAEKLCGTRFSSNETNDASDACRHFVWAALLAHELNNEKANKYLDAHEDDAKQPEEERAMDLANNRLGVLIATELKTNKTFTEDNLLKQFDKVRASKRLVILNKGGEP